MISLDNLKKRKGHKNKKTRLGRGYGSGHGGHTSTRGNKGQKARSGGNIPAYFEGGQLPLIKRLPHLKGFINKRRKVYTNIKTSRLNKLNKKSLTPKDLVSEGVLRKVSIPGVKVLYDEDVTIKVDMKGFKYSKKAKESIEKAGGQAE